MGDNATATAPWSLIPEAIPIAVLVTALLVAIVMITHHCLAVRAERLRNDSETHDDKAQHATPNENHIP
jgi:hypothetical protein